MNARFRHCCLLALSAFAGAACMPAAHAQHYDMKVKIVNNTGQTIYSIYTSPGFEPDYGRRDLLGAQVLNSGYQIDIDFDVMDARKQCILDIKAEGAGTRAWRRDDVNVCRLSTINLN